jgi:hypothetical protein
MKRSLFLTVFGSILAFLTACKKSDSAVAGSSPSTSGAHACRTEREELSLSVGMPQDQAMKLLEGEFTNTHLQQAVIEVSPDRVASSSTNASGLDWSHKSGRFCVEVYWSDGKLIDLNFGTDAEYQKPFGDRTFYAVKRLTFSHDGKKIAFEMPK